MANRKLRSLMLLALITSLLMAGTALAQITSRVTGVVQDTNKAVVPGAKVSLTNEATGVAFTTVTSESGVYVFEAIQVGSYTVTVEMSGFKKYVGKGNVLTIGAPLTVNINLEVGQTSEQVEVVGAYERVQTSTSGNIGGLVDNKTLVDLP